MTLREIPVGDIKKNPNNPRQTFRESKIEELAASIEKQGLLQPPLARPVTDGFQLVHGERRLRAVERLGWDTVTVNVEEMTDSEALEVSITENLQREDVSPIAEARSYQMLIEEHGLTQTDAAERLGVSQADISNKLGLLDLPEELQEDILRKILTPWQAKQLARVWGNYWLWDLAIDWDLSVRELRSIVDQLEADDEYVSFRREWSAERLGDYWDRAGDDLEAETRRVTTDGGVESLHGDVEYLDRFGRPVQFLHEAETTAALHWARENVEHLDGADHLADYGSRENSKDLWEDRDVRPLRFFMPTQTFLLGYYRLDIADRYDYTGDFEIEIIYPAGFFDWGERVREIDRDRVGGQAK